MKHPFTVAVCISAALHGAALLLAPRGEESAPEPSPVLAVDLVEPALDARAASDPRGATAPDEESGTGEAALSAARRDEGPVPARAAVAEASRAHAVVPVTARAGAVSDEAPLESAPTPSPADPLVTAARSDRSTAARAAEISEDVASVAASPPRLAPRAERAASLQAMSAGESEMLGKRAREWAENLATRPSSQPLAWEHDGRQYVATFSERDADDETGMDEIVVAIDTEANGERLSTEIRLRRLAFSSFAQFVDRWDPGVLLHDDEVDGWFHSNSMITVAPTREASPRFLGKVTATNGVHTDASAGHIKRDQIFVGGLETGVRRIAMPRAAAPFADGPSSPGRVKHLGDATRITFYGDGTYSSTPLESAGAEKRLALPQKPFYLFGAPKKTLHVKGIVRGRVLIYSPDTIVIDGDLEYASDPRVDAGSGDFLGLVADKYVEIAEPDVTGPGDLLIDASIYAKRRFSVRNYGKKEGATLAIYGSLTAGSLSASEPRYRTKVQFDRRLAAQRAPGFPMTDRYQVESWDAAWSASNVGDP
jgi:hypothetical protein